MNLLGEIGVKTLKNERDEVITLVNTERVSHKMSYLLTKITFLWKWNRAKHIDDGFTLLF